jgi:hypothetical protein
MSSKEREMTTGSPPPPSAKQREIHQAQLSLVQASLRAGVRYQRPGRVDKSGKRAN